MSVLDIFKSLAVFFGGLGVFLFGLTTLGNSLESLASDKVRKLFEKLTNNKLKGVLVGAGTTALIHSSSATTVMLVGFVNAGLITLSQAIPIIMGANIGTTVTALMMALPMTEFLAGIGGMGVITLLVTKNEKIKNTCTIIAGMSLIFVGLIVMSNSMEPFSAVFQKFFAITKNPILLVIIGTLFTAIIQSSSASTGILIAMSSIMINGEPVMTMMSAFYLILGFNIGTCGTAALASIGTSANAKRTALVHLNFNIIGSVIFLILYAIPPIYKLNLMFFNTFPTLALQIAFFHIIFNILSTIIMLPFSNFLGKMAIWFIKDDKKSKDEINTMQLKYLNELILNTPSIAVAQVKKEILYMAEISFKNLNTSIDAIVNKDLAKEHEFESLEKHLNFMNRTITEYLVKISSLELSAQDEKVLGSFYHVISDFERVGDYAENIINYTKKMKNEGIEFSQGAKDEILDMFGKIKDLYTKVIDCFEHSNLQLLEPIDKIEDSVDVCKKQLSEAHIKRLNERICSPDSGAIFLSLVSNLERIADHFNNVSRSIKDYAKVNKVTQATILKPNEATPK